MEPLCEYGDFSGPTPCARKGRIFDNIGVFKKGKRPISDGIAFGPLSDVSAAEKHVPGEIADVVGNFKPDGAEIV